MAESEPYQSLEDAVFFGRKLTKRKGIWSLPMILPSEPLRPNLYVLGWEGLKGITLSLPWAPWFLGHTEGTGTVVVVDVVESKWWVVRVLAEYGKKQVWGGRALNKWQIWA